MGLPSTASPAQWQYWKEPACEVFSAQRGAPLLPTQGQSAAAVQSLVNVCELLLSCSHLGTVWCGAAVSQ
ncbi:hypothetical protein chiPu_0023954 [Chiloscyllium punctatum]|uniref:Uncharacterized protein n=1 Tax=Chiloscyllium punctatum TaxID=137246 RepID=A0A401TBX9_CHIPU|nr:hypothetical protein [Chiloscyllium punctatum]